MIIKKISVTNFGKLSNLTIVPCDGLNIIYAPNESGKSTLLAFIKFIFYGTRQKKSKGDIFFKEKYMPWNAMPMSGSIEFTHNDKDYIIYRSEGAKNGSKKLEIINPLTGEKYLDIIDPGRHFFSVSEKAFSDSCFVTDIYSLTDADEDIVSVISQGSSDSASYTRVKAALEEKIASLSSPKRSGARLNVISARISEAELQALSLSRQINELEEQCKQTEDAEEKLKNRQKELEATQLKWEIPQSSIDTSFFEKMAQTEKENLDELKNQLSCLSEVRLPAVPLASFFSLFLLFAFLCVFLLFKMQYALGAVCGVLSFVFAGASAWVLFRHISRKNTRLFSKISLESRIADSVKKLNDLQLQISSQKYTGTVTEIDEMGNPQTNFFTNDKINDIINKINRLTEEMTVLSLRRKTLKIRIDELIEQRNALYGETKNLSAEADEIRSKLSVYKTALGILETAFSKMREDFAPRLSESAFSIFSEVSDSVYGAVLSTESFDASVRVGDEFKDSRCLSSGTRDLLYLSLRIAVCNCISDADAPPMFFDDCFSSFDDERCARMIKKLYSLSAKQQLFVCTCRSREAEISGDCPYSKVISL